MTDRPALELKRESLFVQTLSAFLRGDHSFLEAAVREDVVLVVPGSSPLSGVHRGREAFRRYLSDAGKTFGPGGNGVTFEHQGDVMVATHEVGIRFPARLVESTVRVSITFDDVNRVAGIVVE